MSFSNASTKHLRDTFKNKMDDLTSLLNQVERVEDAYAEIQSEIQKVSEHIEKVIQTKTKQLETDFHNQILGAEYLKTVTESFDDLERLLRSSQTFADAIQGQTKDALLQDIQRHNNHTLVPLLNILSKLENDFFSVTTQTINKKEESLNKTMFSINHLMKEEKILKNSILIFNRKKKLSDVITNIRFLNLKRQLLKLSIHHDKLNLYYFNHDHPKELKEIKQKADELRFELAKYKEIEYA